MLRACGGGGGRNALRQKSGAGKKEKKKARAEAWEKTKAAVKLQSVARGRAVRRRLAPVFVKTMSGKTRTLKVVAGESVAAVLARYAASGE